MSMNLPRISFSQMLCFVTVVDAGTLAEAARRLGMSTSGISKTLSRLEETHGIKLLHRSTHALSLTVEGERLIGLARDALQTVSELESAMGEAEHSGAAGRVRISAPTAFVRTCLVPHLPRFLEEFPSVHLDVRGSDHLVDLAESGIDLALRAGDITGTPGFIQQAVMRFSWVTCAAPSYLARHGTPAMPSDLRGHRLIGFRNQRTGTVDAWRFTTPKGFDDTFDRWLPDASMAFDDANAALAMVRAGAGIAWAPDWLAAEALRSGEVVPVLEDWGRVVSPITLVRRDRRLTPRRITVVIDWLKETLSLVSGSTGDGSRS